VETTRLKRGVRAPFDGDHITVNELPSGSFEFRGVSTVQKPAPSHPVVTNSVNPQSYPSFDMAVAAGLEWAERHKVKQLYIEFTDALGGASADRSVDSKTPRPAGRGASFTLLHSYDDQRFIG
jgi:hypothetical protein